MPMKPLRACSVPGCRNLGTGSRCPAHQEAADASRQAWASTEGSASSRGYGATWRRLRQMVLNRDPICRQCRREPSFAVDHVVPKARGGDDSMENLQGLCRACHAAKTAKDAAQGRKLTRPGRGRQR